MTFSKKDSPLLFDQIAKSYDLTNRILSCFIDKIWRKKLARLVPHDPGLYRNNLKNRKFGKEAPQNFRAGAMRSERPLPSRQGASEHENFDGKPTQPKTDSSGCFGITLLDLATGTGDQLIEVMRMNPHIDYALGIDLSSEMVQIGKQKCERTPFAKKIELKVASAMAIPVQDHFFDCATISFGIRNMESISLCLQEIDRVLKPKGTILILEFSFPRQKWLKKFYLWYLRNMVPLIGGILSKNFAAYRYLNKTIEEFPYGNEFCRLLEEVGFKKVKWIPLTFGIASIYHGIKK
ncbi:MAG: ubiquinone/menaquinone biosynthesis methyltransferase [Chlamydiae bacterium]|nr:ubiquinone/menaquinone biosynthesis methyltransferase [Chlamydiota bacterium]